MEPGLAYGVHRPAQEDFAGFKWSHVDGTVRGLEHLRPGFAQDLASVCGYMTLGLFSA